MKYIPINANEYGTTPEETTNEEDADILTIAESNDDIWTSGFVAIETENQSKKVELQMDSMHFNPCPIYHESCVHVYVFALSSSMITWATL